MIWSTLFVESWKRKQNLIGNQWLCRNFNDPTTENPDYQSATTFDAETRTKMTKNKKSS